MKDLNDFQLEFDDKLKLLNLDLEFRIDKEKYDSLKTFILESFKDIGYVYFYPSLNCSAINFNVDDEYCCFSINHNCLFIRRIYIPSEKRGKGFLKEFLVSFEQFLPSVGLNCICFENLENEGLAKFLLNRNYCKANFNYPKNDESDNLFLIDAYKNLND